MAVSPMTRRAPARGRTLGAVQRGERVDRGLDLPLRPVDVCPVLAACMVQPEVIRAI